MSKQVVIIPTYNEAENIRLMIQAVMGLRIEFDIMIVDDGSPDGTADIVREMMERFPGRILLEEREGKLGLGTAYLHGFKKTLALGYDFMFEMDCDFSHNPEDLIKLYRACAVDGNDMAIGSRYVQGVNVVNWPMNRVLLSYFASHYVRWVTGLPISDSTAGFKCYRRKVLETIDLDEIQFVGYAFQIEMKFLTWKYGFKIKEVPIIFTDRARGQSKMSKSIVKEAAFGVLYMKIQSWFRNFHPKENMQSNTLQEA